MRRMLQTRSIPYPIRHQKPRENQILSEVFEWDCVWGSRSALFSNPLDSLHWWNLGLKPAGYLFNRSCVFTGICLKHSWRDRWKAAKTACLDDQILRRNKRGREILW